MVIFFDLI
jgi:hypothetical protein